MNTGNLKEFKNMPKSYWIDSTGDTDYPSLDRDINIDTIIVGGGIVGIANAYQLQKSGIDVAILEGRKIAQGTSGHTTAKITSQHNLIYAKLIKQFGKNSAQQYATANQLAIKEIKTIADENNIDCDYCTQSAFVYTQDENFVKQIEDEVKAAKSLGIKASFVNEIPFNMEIRAGIRFDNQAQFHPRKLLLPLAKILHKGGVQIYEQSRVTELNKNQDGKYLLTTSDNHTVTANRVIIASHYPFYNKQDAYYARISQTMTYAILVKAKEKFPGGMFINAEKPNRSMRGLNTESDEHILIVGDSHKTGQGGDTNQHYNALVDFAKNLFTVEDIPYRWSTQDCMTADGVPYVGFYSAEMPNIYIATGFGKWGISNSLVSSILINDLITKGSSPWEGIYNPSRESNIPAIEEASKQNPNIPINPMDNNIAKGLTDVGVKNGEGKIVDINGKKIGAFRDEDGKLHLINPTCAHMGCEVNWNAAERTWDCPCHGSRYDIDGNVISGPAVHPLSPNHDVNTVDKLTKGDF